MREEEWTSDVRRAARVLAKTMAVVRARALDSSEPYRSRPVTPRKRASEHREKAAAR